MLKRITLDLATASSVQRADAYRQHLAQHLAPKCYLYVPLVGTLAYWGFLTMWTNLARAFSTVAADKQFATLGIVLLATLARLAKATGLNFQPKADIRVANRRAVAAASVAEDRGERLGRDEIDPLLKREEPLSETNARSVGHKPKDSASKKATKRKKKNAIDDLFSGLL